MWMKEAGLFQTKVLGMDCLGIPENLTTAEWQKDKDLEIFLGCVKEKYVYSQE